MLISYAPYILESLVALNASCNKQQRQGALLRCEFAPNLIGYSDCHPWPEFGDDPLSEQLTRLSKNILTPVTRQSLYFAQREAQARSMGRSIFANLSMCESHALVAEPLQLKPEHILERHNAGFRFLKIKLHKNWPAEINHLNALNIAQLAPIKLRLDFNSVVKHSELDMLLSLIQPLVPICDFIEDPLAYSHKIWSNLKTALTVNIALDWEECDNVGSSLPFDFVVIKPARENVIERIMWAQQAGKPLIITSYMDHPVGQLSAALIAAELAADNFVSDQEQPLATKTILHGCGLLTHTLYQPNVYSERLFNNSPYLPILDGTGWGYDDLLERETWIALK